LDLLEFVPVSKGVEVPEELVQHAHHLGRWQMLRTRREVDNVGEQNRRGGELVGDRLRLCLQLLGDRAGQDVQEQVLSLLLGTLHGRQRVLPLLGEEREEREHDRPADYLVEREYRARKLCRQGGDTNQRPAV